MQFGPKYILFFEVECCVCDAQSSRKWDSQRRPSSRCNLAPNTFYSSKLSVAFVTYNCHKSGIRKDALVFYAIQSHIHTFFSKLSVAFVTYNPHKSGVHKDSLEFYATQPQIRPSPNKGPYKKWDPQKYHRIRCNPAPNTSHFICKQKKSSRSTKKSF